MASQVMGQRRARAATFCEALLAHGLTLPTRIEPGKLYRIPGDGKGPRNRAGWCKLFADGCGGVFGDWSTGLFETWQAARDLPLTPAERQAFQRRCALANAERIRQRDKQHRAAAERAALLLAESTAPDARHAYLQGKSINAPEGLRELGGRLLVPMHDVITGKLRGLQSIWPDGEKRFTPGMAVTGCAFAIGVVQTTERIALCEGMATGASIHAATGWRVVCAFTASNLPAVAKAIRQQDPQACIVICADNDHGTERASRGNAGLKAGREAARAISALLVAPPARGGTDWNDYVQAHGLDALGRELRAAVSQ